MVIRKPGLQVGSRLNTSFGVLEELLDEELFVASLKASSTVGGCGNSAAGGKVGVAKVSKAFLRASAKGKQSCDGK